MPEQQHIAIAICTSEKQILLQKRRDVRLWALPGGKVENGESYQHAAIREMFEETGLRSLAIQHVCDLYQPQLNRILHLVECKIIRNTDFHANREVIAIRWFKNNHLPRLRLPSTKRIIDLALSSDPRDEVYYFPHWMVMANAILMSTKHHT